MGDFQAGKWIIGILIYYIAFFLIISSLGNIVNVGNINNQYLTYNDPGFQDRLSEFANPNNNGACAGTGRAMNFIDNIQCARLELDDYDIDGCNNVSGCSWRNVTDLFGIEVLPAGCGDGLVNQTYYNITGGIRQYCKSSGLQNESICKMFKCVWVNVSDQGNDDFTNPVESNRGLTNIWNTIKWVVTFRADVGWKHYNWLFSILFFWIEGVALIWCIYMALPLIN